MLCGLTKKYAVLGDVQIKMKFQNEKTNLYVCLCVSFSRVRTCVCVWVRVGEKHGTRTLFVP